MKPVLTFDLQSPIGSWLRSCALFTCAAVMITQPVVQTAAYGAEHEAELSQSADEETEAARPIVSVSRFDLQSVPAQFSLFGVTGTHYQQKLVVEVEGRIASLSPKLNPGMSLKKGDEIAVIEDSSYRAALATAEQAVAASELSLLQEEQRSKQARLDWERAQIGNRKPTALALREPFLKLERLKLKAAEAALMEAKRNLQNTRVIAPFDAVVMSRSSTPAAYVTRGSEIAEIYSTEELSIEVSLSAEQWKLLLRDNGKPVPLNAVSAEVRNDAGQTWEASIVSEGAVVDTQTRQQSLRLKVTPRNVSGAVLKPGSFVRVILTGRAIENVLYVPASAVTLKGFIWSVSDDEQEERQLERYAVTPLLTQDDMVVIDATQLPEKDEWQIILNPISRYLPGQLVEVREAGE